MADFIQMWDPKTRSLASVNTKYVDKFKSDGYTTNLPTQADKAAMRKDAMNGIDYRTDPNAYQPTLSGGSLSYQNSDILNNIDALQQAKEDAMISGFKRSRDSALSTLSSEEATKKPKYYDSRNAVSASNQLGRKSFAEFLASRGEAKSGVMDEAVRDSERSLAGETGLLRRQEAADFSDIARRRSDVQNAYTSDVANARAGLQTAALESKIAEMQRLRDIEREDERYADSREDVAYNKTQNDQQTEEKRFLQTINRFYNDFAAERNRIQNDGDTSNDWQIPYLEAAREEKLQSQAAERQAQMNAMAAADKELYKRAFDMWKESGVATAEIANILGIPVGSKTESYLKTQYDTNKPYYAPEKVATPKQQNWQDYYDVGRDMLGKFDTTDGVYKGGMSHEQIRQWIYSLPIPDQDAEQLERVLGVTPIDMTYRGGR